MYSTRKHRDVLWVDLDSDFSRVPSSDFMLVLIYAYARAGVRIGEEYCKEIGAYGRDTRVSDSNETSFFFAVCG